MKTYSTFLLLWLASLSFGQQTIVSGYYDMGLKLAFDKHSKKITGYFEDYTGDHQQFSCVFYIEGIIGEKQFKIKTYYPEEVESDCIEGTAEILNPKTLQFILSEEHGGCWNVQHFTEEPVSFTLDKETQWIQISYVVSKKSVFFVKSTGTKKAKSYLVKGNPVCVEKIANHRAYCTFFGDKITKGWILLKDLHTL